MKYIILMVVLISMLSFGCSNDVVTTKTGLRYIDEKNGQGKAAEMGDMVTLHLSIWIVKDSSNLFGDWSKDSTKTTFLVGTSKETNQPVKIMLGSGQFIKGSDEGIAGMKPGGVRTIVIPSKLAYGPTGAGPVPPNTDIRLQIELLDAKVVPAVKPWDYDSTKIQTTASGLKYVILQEGTGVLPDSNDIVVVHYSGFFLDGRKFDSSVERGEPLTVPLGQRRVIPGWEEGLSLLKKGTKAKLIVPPALAYGDRGMGAIPPGSTLIFDIEVIDIKKN